MMDIMCHVQYKNVKKYMFSQKCNGKWCNVHFALLLKMAGIHIWISSAQLKNIAKNLSVVAGVL